MLSYKQIERIIKGASNHRRVQILDLIQENPELSVSEISEKIKSDLKNVSEHIRKLTISGLIMKRSQGKNIRHKITKRGTNVLTFCRTLE